jgi:hypothetical protein
VEIPNLKLPGGSNGAGPEMSEFIQQTDEARAIARPTNVQELYVELETEAAEEEQEKLYLEKAEREAAGADKLAAQLAHDADQAVEESKEKSNQLKKERERQERDKAVLTRYARRRTDAKKVYWVRWILFLLGDIAGIGGAALLLGELPINALLQATSAAVSAVTLGGVGREVRYAVAAKQRQKPLEDLTDEEREYAFLFGGPDLASALIKVLILIALTGMVLIAGGIFALRGAAEGSEVAVAFGCFALAIGLASFYNSYDVACEVSEYLDTRSAEQKKLEKAAGKARREPVIAQRAGAVAEGKSARAINKAAGDGAAKGLRRALYGLLNANPGVAGNGLGASRRNGHRGNGSGRRPGGGS